MANAKQRYRWAVWLDGRGPVLVTSRLRAKRLCKRAKERAYFCRHYAAEGDLGLSISDFVVWCLGQSGKWFRYVWLSSESNHEVSPFGKWLAASAHQRSRYARCLRNERMWKIGGKSQLAVSGIYPADFQEITTDSDDGMACAGFRCIGEFPSISHLRSAEVSGVLSERCYGTVEDGCLRVWIEDAVHI